MLGAFDHDFVLIRVHAVVLLISFVNAQFVVRNCPAESLENGPKVNNDSSGSNFNGTDVGVVVKLKQCMDL